MNNMRPIVFVATPLALQEGDPSPRANIEFAEMVCRLIAAAGGAPFAPHLLYTRFLGDEVAAERQIGIECGQAVLARADEAWFVLPPWRTTLSGGMKAERATAQKFHIPCVGAAFPLAGGPAVMTYLATRPWYRPAVRSPD